MSPLLFCLTLAACGGGSSSNPAAPATTDAARGLAPAASNSTTSASTDIASTGTITDAAIAPIAVPSAAAVAAAAAPSVPPAPLDSMSTPIATTASASSASTPVADSTGIASSDIVVASAGNTSTAATPASTSTSSTIAPAGQDASQYVLTFRDEFDSGASFDTSRWTTDIYYKANNPTKNYNVANGTLNIWPALDSKGAFFDRTVVSAGRFSQQYGFFEVEAKLPVGAGLHPVISLTADNGPEIALMHAYSGAPNGAWSNSVLHPVDYVYTAMSGPDNYIGEFRARTFRSMPDLSAAFHKYGVRWDANTVTYYLDGVQLGQPIAHNAIRTPMYFYIGLWMVNEETSPAIGSGTLSASNPYTPTGSGNALQVNYARAWRFKN
jgi:hypothetical protein